MESNKTPRVWGFSTADPDWRPTLLRLEPWQLRILEAMERGERMKLVPTRRGGYRWVVIEDSDAR